MGKTSWVVAAAVLVVGGIAVGIPDTSYRFVLALGVLGLCVVYFVGVVLFAHRHPGVSLLEGAELIQWRQMDIAAKAGPPIEGQPILPGPASEGDAT